MATIRNMSRRQFIASSGATTALVLGAQLSPNPVLAALKGNPAAILNHFVKIDLDGTVTLTCSRSEMGQGVRTGMPMILADELEADWDRIQVWQAPGDPEKYDPAGKDAQNTDGSRSTRHSFQVMRELGAAARDMLERAAAEQWGIDRAAVYANRHRLHRRDTGDSVDFGDVVETAADMDLNPGPDAPAPRLKDPSEWRYIGKDMPVIDNQDMSTGRAVYGADVDVPNLKIAVIARPPVYRGRVRRFDARKALEVDGVDTVVEVPALPADTPAQFRALGGVAVIGSNTWSVSRGRDLLDIDWDDGPFVTHESASYDQALVEAARKGGKRMRDRGSVDDAFAAADNVVEAEYFVPYFAHTPMEPPVATVDATSKPVRIWAPTQAPNETRQYVAEALGIDTADVECHITLLGGGFGRKSKPDFACEAALLSREIGAPVRVQWTREDEIQNGYYHAASAQHVKAALDADGKVTAWHHRMAAPTLFALWNPDQRDSSNLEVGMGLVDLPYTRIPNIRIETGQTDTMIRVGWYRSVNNIQHAFAINSFVNELAVAAGRDPLEFMLELIGDDDELDLAEDGVEEFWNYGDTVEEWPVSPNRLANALRVVAERSNYDAALPEGQGIGLACHRSFHSYVATAVRVAVDKNGSFTVPRVDVAIDCGRYVNPEGIRKQIEGACVYGNSIARNGKITTRRGAVEQSNFHDYSVSRMSDAPLDVRVHVVDDFVHLRPCGVGEPGVPPYAPALANALYAATKRRIRSLPITSGQLSA